MHVHYVFNAKAVLAVAQGGLFCDVNLPCKMGCAQAFQAKEIVEDVFTGNYADAAGEVVAAGAAATGHNKTAGAVQFVVDVDKA